jgi:DNA-binding transcriptional ArsR family regulator
MNERSALPAFDAPVFDATNARHRALGHPIRHRILLVLGDAPATLSQLARRLTVPKGGVAHHLKVLVEADLIRRADARTVRGGTEVYYERVHTRLHVDPAADPEAQRAALVAVADAVAADPDDPLLVLRGLRLSDAQARRLKVTLAAFVDDLDESPSGRRHGLLVGVYAI